MNTRFSNRPFGVKHFQTIHRCSVDVAHGLALLFGIGTKAKVALEIDLTMRERAPAGWKGDDTREKQVLNALFPIMARDRTATQAIFEIIKNQPGY
jgi:hypothetical protein